MTCLFSALFICRHINSSCPPTHSQHHSGRPSLAPPTQCSAILGARRFVRRALCLIRCFPEGIIGKSLKDDGTVHPRETLCACPAGLISCLTSHHAGPRFTPHLRGHMPAFTWALTGWTRCTATRSGGESRAARESRADHAELLRQGWCMLAQIHRGTNEVPVPFGASGDHVTPPAASGRAILSHLPWGERRSTRLKIALPEPLSLTYQPARSRLPRPRALDPGRRGHLADLRPCPARFMPSRTLATARLPEMILCVDLPSRESVARTAYSRGPRAGPIWPDLMVGGRGPRSRTMTLAEIPFVRPAQ